MTVGISLTNGKEAVVIADSRVSFGERQSDSRDKIKVFSYDNYVGVIFGTGHTNIIQGTTKGVDNLNTGSLDEFVDAVAKGNRERLGTIDHNYLTNMREDIGKRAVLIADEEQRKRWVYEEQQRVFERYMKNKQETDTLFMVVAYDKQRDKERGKIRVFSLNEAFSVEDFYDHRQIGSGRDGAHLYLSTKLQGVDVAKLPLADLLFFAVNAYGHSTVNMGVGGTPKIALVSEGGVLILNEEKSVSLVNLSGAYLAEWSEKLSSTNTRNAMRGILEAEAPQYDVIAKLMNIEQQTLTSIYIPYSSWQERANRKLFPTKKEQ